MGLRIFLLVLGVLAGGLGVAAVLMGDLFDGTLGIFGSVIVIGKAVYGFRRVR